jgi:hypothetical protein
MAHDESHKEQAADILNGNGWYSQLCQLSPHPSDTWLLSDEA